MIRNPFTSAKKSTLFSEGSPHGPTRTRWENREKYAKILPPPHIFGGERFFEYFAFFRLFFTIFSPSSCRALRHRSDWLSKWKKHKVAILFWHHNLFCRSRHSEQILESELWMKMQSFSSGNRRIFEKWLKTYKYQFFAKQNLEKIHFPCINQKKGHASRPN